MLEKAKFLRKGFLPKAETTEDYSPLKNKKKEMNHFIILIHMQVMILLMLKLMKNITFFIYKSSSNFPSNPGPMDIDKRGDVYTDIINVVD